MFFVKPFLIKSSFLVRKFKDVYKRQEVTLIQRSERLLKEYDPEISEAITKALTEQGINLVTGATLSLIHILGKRR